MNRDLLPEFRSVIAGADWDVALLQECPPRWTSDLAAGCRAEPFVSLTSRNELSALRGLLARQNPDLMASGEGGCNLILVRADAITERRELELTTEPERRTMQFARIASGTCVANLHASNAAPEKTAPEVLRAAEQAVAWAGDAPLLFGGDLNLRPDRAPDAFTELADHHGLAAPTAPGAIDHLLVRGLEVAAPPARWPSDRREVVEDGLRIRLSDHAPVDATFA